MKKKKIEWTAIKSPPSLKTRLKWFYDTCLPALNTLLKSDSRVEIEKELLALVTETTFEQVQKEKKRTEPPTTAEIQVDIPPESSVISEDFQNLKNDLFNEDENFKIWNKI